MGDFLAMQLYKSKHVKKKNRVKRMNEIGVSGRERKSCRKRQDRNCLPTDANLFGYIAKPKKIPYKNQKHLRHLEFIFACLVNNDVVLVCNLE